MGVAKPPLEPVIKPGEFWFEGEPPHSAVILTESFTGTAWQRHFSDGLWHSTTGRVLPFEELGMWLGLPKFRVIIYLPPSAR